MTNKHSFYISNSSVSESNLQRNGIVPLSTSIFYFILIFCLTSVQSSAFQSAAGSRTPDSEFSTSTIFLKSLMPQSYKSLSRMFASSKLMTDPIIGLNRTFGKGFS